MNPGPSFDFVVISEGRTFFFHPDQPGSIQLLENGESVSRDMNCGAQDARVAVVYTPSGTETEGELRGELRVLEFLR